MNLFTMLSNLLLKPLELVFETVFSLVLYVTNNMAASIFFLSLIMNLLVLPLYKKADAMQEEARDTEARLSHWVNHIRKNFTGDERYMILQTYYRQNHYKPTDALRGSVSLLLEVPFFMAAYRFLSGLPILQGVSFGPIRDLGQPDALLCIWGVTINVLPILMTLINLVSGYIYTRGFPMKAKLQLYGMALVFLVLLYQSPSALVFYWTLNNVFSLVKNIVYKVKNPRKFVSLACSLAGLAGIAALLIHPLHRIRHLVAAAAVLVLLQVPSVLYFLRSRRGTRVPAVPGKKESLSFLLGGLFLALLTGLYIPGSVIANSPEEFVNACTLTNPLQYLLMTLLIACGTFVIWAWIFYQLSGPGARRAMGAGVWMLSGIAVVDYMFFGRHYGNLSSSLIFDVTPTVTLSEVLINLGVILAVGALLYLLWKRKKDLIPVAYLAAILAITGMTLVQVPKIRREADFQIREVLSREEEMPEIPLSRTGKNVMVIMMDRAVGLNIPYILQEKPELRDQFSGFVYYPRTLSHGQNTNLGSPALLGGYEYRPEQMNLRDQDSLQVKHDEALKVMPVLFHEQGYEVTVLDPPLAGYSVVPANTVFADYPDIHMSRLMSRFSRMTPESAAIQEARIPRTFFFYSLFKAAPVPVQPFIYSRGSYMDPSGLNMDDSGQSALSISRASGFAGHFMESYQALEHLPELTAVRDGDQDTFLFMANDTSHEAVMLQEPDYTPQVYVDNTRYDAEHMDRFVYQGHRMRMDEDIQMRDYHCNMAYMLQLGKWFDYLRAEGVYDNTRIIIAADHGRPLFHFPELASYEPEEMDILHYNPVLMVKDFASAGDVETDLTFMTNADVPVLAMEGLIPDPVNPFTGNPINSDAKQGPQNVFLSGEHCTGKTTPFYDPAPWYRVNGDMFDLSSWERITGSGLLPQP